MNVALSATYSVTNTKNFSHCSTCNKEFGALYSINYVCIAVFTLDAGLLARNQYPEGPATGHLDTVFLRFPVSISEC
jgi:hypothetical protein